MALALAFAAIAACEEPPGASDTLAPAAAAAARYDDEIIAVDAELARLRDAAQRDPAFWPAWEELARALLARAGLTGRFEDYAGAVEAGQTVERLANPEALCPTGIRVHLAVHRLAAAQRLFGQCEQSQLLQPEHRIELMALRADLAFQDGRYDEALHQSRRVLEQRESPQDLARLALYHAATGAPSEALALLDRAEKVDHAGTPRLRAWLALRRGLITLHRGRWDEALAHYLAAERHLAGWWLVEEHIAEVRALLGDRDAAAEIYRSVLTRVDPPELMDALAVLLRDAGRAAEAQDWVAHAEARHGRRLEQLPEAAAGHALEHFLRFAPAIAETLALARRNAGLRGDGEARLLLVRALLAAGRTREAEREIRHVLGSAWNTAETHAWAHQVFQRAGNAEEARSEAAAAAAMNPRWREQYLTMR